MGSWDDTNPISCSLCPRMCGALRAAGQRGPCGAADEVVVARCALHFWEEPPLSGESGSGTIFFAYCSLGCSYCQNFAISHGGKEAQGHPVTCEQLAQMCLDLQDEGALNVNFVTPTHYAPHIRAAVHMARGQGMNLPVVWNTSGYETVEAIKDDKGTVDVYLTDFKYADAALGRRYSQVPNYPQQALQALDAMVEQVGAAVYDEYNGQTRMVRGVVVRHLLLPGNLDDSKHVVSLLHERYGEDIRLSLMNQYTPVLAHRAESGDGYANKVLEVCPELGGTVSAEDYEELLDFADGIGVADYFWQDGKTCTESFIPSFSDEPCDGSDVS